MASSTKAGDLTEDEFLDDVVRRIDALTAQADALGDRIEKLADRYEKVERPNLRLVQADGDD